ncbi:MAG: hypothetical protein KC619_36165 [Myxococcales bacterium]|nr:hypothetical protein [Myxococcales bacterium]
MHHRGQIHQLLSAAGQRPPQLDELFCVGDAPKRTRDLARLGLSEDDVFGPIEPPESQ